MRDYTRLNENTSLIQPGVTNMNVYMDACVHHRTFIF